jgi:VWFA-related protein
MRSGSFGARLAGMKQDRLMKRFALLPLTAMMLGQTAQMPTIRVPVRLVTLPTLVFSREGRPISGLQRGDFHVYDNGRRQTVTLDANSAPISVVLAIQANQDVRTYVPFIARAGSVADTLLTGESGEAAVIIYGEGVAVVKPFAKGDVQSALKNLVAGGAKARMIDAGLRAISLLRERPVTRARVLLFIGQPLDIGSESPLSALEEQAERENVVVYALALPEFGKAFVSDTFSLEGVSKEEKGGFKGGVDLGNLVAVLRRSSHAKEHADPFSILTAATGGTELHFRKQKELENAIATIGLELRSEYLLSFYADSTESGYHTVKIEVDKPGAKAFSRPGYWLSTN